MTGKVSQLCLLAMVLCLPLGCLGGLSQCMDEIEMGPGPPLEGVSNYRAYRYQPVTASDCNDLELTCSATILPNVTLTGRTWFITNIRPNYGLNYDNNTIHDFRVQCPRGTLLHLYVQNSDLPPSPTCTSVDFVRVGADRLPTGEVTFCGDNDDVAMTYLYNNGLGRIFADGKASISFCSNNVNEDPSQTFDGFVIRATCLNPAEFQWPGCVDFAFFDAWDPEFVRIIDRPLPSPDKITLPHRRRRGVSKRVTNWALKQMHREKKFVGTAVTTIDLDASNTVTLTDGILTVIFANGTMDPIVIPRIFCLTTFTPLIGSRQFFGSAPFTFYGPGKLEHFGRIAWLTYSVPEMRYEEIFLPSPAEMMAANIIYEHIFNNWIFPYPVIDLTERRDNADPIFPLPSGNCPPTFPDLDIPGWRSTDSLGFIQEDIQSSPAGPGSGNCKRAIRIEVAPSNTAKLPDEIVGFCGFFRNSCDLTLRTACREAERIDSGSFGK